MDRRTTSLLDALAHPGAAMLLLLCEREATEAELIASIPSATQPTANRRLAELERIGLIAREAGRTKAPGRSWHLREPAATEAVLSAALNLSQALATTEERERRAAARRLRRARAERLGIRRVGDP